MKDLNMDWDSPSIDKVLGMHWCVKSDVFKFDIMIHDRPLTRRGMLSTITSIYDMLRFVNPVVLS